MAKINGTLNAVLSGANKTLHTTSATLSVNVNLADTSTKDDAGWATHLKGRRDWTITIDGLYDMAGAGLTPDEIFTAIIDREADTVIKFTFDGITGAAGQGYTGNGTFSDISVTGASEEAITYSATITGNGPLAPLT